MRLFIRPLRHLGGFTLIELLTVMAVIAILAGLILSISGYAEKKGAMARAQAEVAALSTACESYKTDNGAYPAIVTTGTANVNQKAFTSNIPSDNLDPRTMGNPSTVYSGMPGSQTNYTSASLELYVALTGDVACSGTGGGLGVRNYITDLRQDALGRTYANASVSSTNPVLYISDPFGNSYGYSTANSFYQSCLNAGGTVQPNPPGFNPTFDIWCTGGQTANPYSGGGSTAPGTPGDPMLQWVKNW
jgi:prepilin-type N-terminal cleavage/methylation domain-containing protein